VCVPCASKPYVAVEQEYEEAADGRPHCVAGLAQHRYGIRREADSINQQAAEQKDETDSSNVSITTHFKREKKAHLAKSLAMVVGVRRMLAKGPHGLFPTPGACCAPSSS
jgi:hypothetical protein